MSAARQRRLALLVLLGLAAPAATTPAYTTTNAQGDRVLTQWFERARFEWHPGNPQPYRVLLGLLGAEIQRPPRPAIQGRIAYIGTLGQPGGGVFVYNADGSTNFVTSTQAHEYDPAWSPDGTRIAVAVYGRPGSEAPEIFVMNADGSNLERLTTSRGLTGAMEPAWSPDGASLALNSVPGYGEEANASLLVMPFDPESGPAAQVRVAASYGYSRPSWTAAR